MKSSRNCRTSSLKPNERDSSSRLGRFKLSDEFSNGSRLEKPCGGSVTARTRQSDFYDFRSNSPNYNLTQNTLRESNMFSTFSEGMNSNSAASKCLAKTQAKSYVPCLSNRNRTASSLNISKEITVVTKTKEVTRFNSKVSKENVIQTQSAGPKNKENTVKQAQKHQSDNLRKTKVSPIRDVKLKRSTVQPTKHSSSRSSLQNSKKIRTALILREQQLKQALDESRSKDLSMEEPSHDSIDQPQLETSFNQTFRPLDISFTQNIQYDEKLSSKDQKRSSSLNKKVAVRSLKNSVLAKLAFRELHKSTLDSLLIQNKSFSSGFGSSTKESRSKHNSFISERQDASPDFGHPGRCNDDKKFSIDSETYYKQPLSPINMLSSSEEKQLNAPPSELVSTNQDPFLEDLYSSNSLDVLPSSLQHKIKHKKLSIDLPDDLNIIKPIKITESDSELEYKPQDESDSSIYVQEVVFAKSIPDGSLTAPSLRSLGSTITYPVPETSYMLQNSSCASCTSENPCIHTTESEEFEDLNNETSTLNILKRAFSEAEEARRVLEESQDTINKSIERHSSVESRYDYEDFIRLQTSNIVSTPDMLGSLVNFTPDSDKFAFTEESHSLDKSVQTDINLQEELLIKILKTLGKDNVLKGFKLLGGFAKYLESQEKI